MTRYFPIVAGVALIVGLTIAQAVISHRFEESNVSAEQRGELLKHVPKNFGDWSGEDKPLDPEVKAKAGSVGIAVSRNYRNSRTGERVDLWLIVGHARDMTDHTPDVCYPGSGFEARAKDNGVFPFVANDKETPFLTNTFYKEDETGRHLIRVFWTWFNSETDAHQGKVVWEAPQKGARWYFANSRALFKMYFISEMRDSQETTEQNACIHFAHDFMPEVEKALKDYDKPAATADAAKETSEGKPAAEAATTATDSSPAAQSSGEQPAKAADATSN